MAAGIVKASSGCVLIGDYDPRVQSVHCKRIAGFVPHETVALDERDFGAYIAYRAALWNVDARRAFARAAELLRERLGDMHEAFALSAHRRADRHARAHRAGPAAARVRGRRSYASPGTRAVFSTHTNVAGGARVSPHATRFAATQA